MWAQLWEAALTQPSKAADVVFMTSSMDAIPEAIRIAEKHRRDLQPECGIRPCGKSSCHDLRSRGNRLHVARGIRRHRCRDPLRAEFHQNSFIRNKTPAAIFLFRGIRQTRDKESPGEPFSYRSPELFVIHFDSFQFLASGSFPVVECLGCSGHDLCQRFTLFTSASPSPQQPYKQYAHANPIKISMVRTDTLILSYIRSFMDLFFRRSFSSCSRLFLLSEFF